MTGRGLRITARIVFFLCGLVALVTAAPYALLRGIDLPVESEWVVFVAALGIVGLCGVAAGALPASWIAGICRKDREDSRLWSAPLRLLGIFAVFAYLAATLAYFAPHTWNLSLQIMLILCPMYFIKMTFDPSPIAIFLLLAPMNAAVYGALGILFGYGSLVFRGRSVRSTFLSHF